MIRRLFHKPVAVVSLAWIAILIILSVLAPVIAPYGPQDQDLAHALEGPSRAHLLGSGVLGLDVLSRLLYGGRVTLVSTAISVSVYALLGVPAGLLAGYRGGLADKIILRLSEVAYAIPGTIMVLVVLAIRPGDETAAMIAVGALAAPALARVVRSATIALREELYIRAARLAGLRDWLILRRNVLPSVMGTVIVHVAIFATTAIILETGLGFLGVGTRQVTWGEMVAEASHNLGNQPWLLVPSGFVIISLVLAFGLIGDGLRDATAEGYSIRQTSRARGRGNKPARSAKPDRALPNKAAANIPPDPPPTGPETGALLALNGLTITFETNGKPVTVVENVSFTVAPGQMVGIVGESGSGKSVTVAALLGLLRGTGQVSAGTMTFAGQPFDLSQTKALAALRARRIALISQDPMSSLDPCFTIRYQLAEVIKANTPLRGTAVGERVLELLRAVRLPEPELTARSYPHQLSGGMAQRVAIALALAGEPDLILADEPTTALDVTVQAEIMDVLRSLGKAIILVTHDWGLLVDLCEKGIVMYSGQVVEEGSVERIVAQPRHPYTVGLLRSNPYFATAGQPLPAIPGVVLPPGRWPVGCHFAERCSLVRPVCSEARVALTVVRDRPGLTRCLFQDQVAAQAADQAAAMGAALGAALEIGVQGTGQAAGSQP
ncbi:MAG: dipeptide/oligopeptide/nickel ABC transporter permease/ATP-binding protein [Bifidobacteriaceae bacterium]|jgi:peptide/nickel transport system permease protein|nr:dipeptide/oligopeptide/nickel ABC transporter permease/ATP-binding protein [Bifidobacteriaceae bacterium]